MTFKLFIMDNHAPKCLTLASFRALPTISFCLIHYISAMLAVFVLKHNKFFPVSGILYTFLPPPKILFPSFSHGCLLTSQLTCHLLRETFLFWCVPHSVVLNSITLLHFDNSCHYLKVCYLFVDLFTTRM